MIRCLNSFRSTVLFFLAVCLVCFGFVAVEKAFGSRQCRLIILFATGGGAGATAGTRGSIGRISETAGTSWRTLVVSSRSAFLSVTSARSVPAVVWSIGRSVAEETARVITALPTARVLSTAKQTVATQIVLIILMPKPRAHLTVPMDSGG